MIDSSENLNFIFLNSDFEAQDIIVCIFFNCIRFEFLTKSNAEFEKNVTCKKLISV